MRIRYRAWQFWQQMWPQPLLPEEEQTVARMLSPAEQQLFARFGASDRRHGYRVMCALCAAGQTHPELLAAALLHDVGKTKVRLSVWQRSLIVLGQLFFPGRLALWGAGEPVGWKRPFVVKMQHAAWGAEMAATAGSSPLTVWLIGHHQDRAPDGDETAVRLLRRLQQADDQN